MKTALIYAVSGIGNTISTLPLVNALYDMGYTTDVVLDKRRGANPIFDAHPYIHQVHDIKHNVPRKYDDVFHCSYCTKYIIPESHGKTGHIIGPFLHDAEVVRFKFEKHEIEYFLDMAREIGWNGSFLQHLPTKKPNIYIPENSIAMSVGYHKADGKSCKKHWGNDNYITLSKLLLSKSYTPVFIGSRLDWETDGVGIGQAFEGVSPKPLFFFDQDLLTSFGILDMCCGYVGNETCMVPAAAALEKPALSLIMKTANKYSIAPKKNRPYCSRGLAILGQLTELTPKLVCDKIMDLIECIPIQEIITL